jgi:outer membrane protein TolC
MSRKPLLLALLSLLAPAPALVAGPPQSSSGRMVQDPVPALQDEVRRLETVVVENPKILGLVEDLTVARARLAAARGEMGVARAGWQSVIAARAERLRKLEARNKDGHGTPPHLAVLRWELAETRCERAEAEGDRATLARELPKVIAFWEEVLYRPRRPADPDFSPEGLTQGEKEILKDLRQARQRLDAAKRR